MSSDNGIVEAILKSRILREGEETWEDVCDRVARAIGNTEDERHDFYALMKSGQFIPNSPTLMNAGTNIGQLSACFVLPIGDSLREIHQCYMNAALVHQSGGGTGFNFSSIRARGSPVKSTDGVASGPVSFMWALNACTEVIKQGGRRRGANMGILNVTHPDILQFVTCKRVEGEFANFNISVMIPDWFMEKVKSGCRDYPVAVNECGYVEVNGEPVLRDLDNPDHNGLEPMRRVITVGEVWDAIVEGMWQNGEPGVLFYDRINRDNAVRDECGFIEATNPCWTGDTRIWTVNGPVTFASLVENGITEVDVLTNVDGKLAFRTMRNIRCTRADADLVEVTVQSSGRVKRISKLRCTPDHNIVLSNGEKVPAMALKPGDRISSVYRYNQGRGYKFLTNRVISVVPIGRGAVYNGTVDETHTYYVLCGDDDAILSANCGEQPLLPYESCNLGSINLSKFVTACDNENRKPTFDWSAFQQVINTAVRFLDNVVDKNVYPLSEIHEQTLKTRKIGLGVMGLHDALLIMGIPYDSEEARDFAGKIAKTLYEQARIASVNLAKERGVCPAFAETENVTAPRNAALTCIAPTGTIAFLANCSHSIEPVFSWVYYRENSIVGERVRVVHPIFEKDLKATIASLPLDSEQLRVGVDALFNEVCETALRTGSIQSVPWLPEEFKRLYKCAMDIPWQDHLKMQAAMQEHIDGGISKTINLPETATRETVADAIMAAWEYGCKGFTTYRNKSRQKVVMALSDAPTASDTPVKEPVTLPETRPACVEGVTYKCVSGCCELFVTVNHIGTAIYEVFVRTAGKGGCEANNEALGRAISVGIQGGIDPEKFIQQFSKVRCDVARHNHKALGNSCPDIVGHCIRMAKNRIEKTVLNPDTGCETVIKRIENPCPKCGHELGFDGGCNSGTCQHCGWSGCS